MGSACCIARKKENPANRNSRELLHRNTIYSPSWSFRRDNRRRVAGEIESISYALSPGFSGDSSTEFKGELSLERGSFASGRSPLRITVSPKSPIHEELVEGHLEASSDLSNTNHGNIEDHNIKESKESSHGVNENSSSSSYLPPISNPTTSLNNSTQPNQIPDNTIKSPALINSGSHGGSSDGWSMRTFTELVASSRRERLSFESNSSHSPSNIINIRNCGICSNLLTEKTIVAVLACGHVYHSSCLEKMTQEHEKWDPSCPICLYGPKELMKMSRKIRQVEEEMKRLSHSGGSSHGIEVKESNGKGNGRDRAFLRRRFSFGSKWGRSMSENGKYGKKGFWSRFR